MSRFICDVCEMLCRMHPNAFRPASKLAMGFLPTGTIPYGRLAAAFGSGNSTGAVRCTRHVGVLVT